MYGLVIQQDYQNGAPTGIPGNNVVVQQVTAVNVQGDIASTAKDIMVLCGKHCKDFHFSGIQIEGGNPGTVHGVDVNCHQLPAEYAAMLA